jgi:hypothetical protein
VLEKTEGAIKYGQYRNRQHWVYNTQNKGQQKPKGQSRMNNTDTDNTGYTIHIAKVAENRIGNPVWTIQTPITLGTQYT